MSEHLIIKYREILVGDILFFDTKNGGLLDFDQEKDCFEICIVISEKSNGFTYDNKMYKRFECLTEEGDIVVHENYPQEKIRVFRK